ncbi:WD repeat-containing protein [Entamoeba marina]
MSEETVTQSNLLRCYRTLGLFAGNKEATHAFVGKASHLMVPIGESFMSYDITRKIDYLYRSANFPYKILKVHMRNYMAIIITSNIIYFQKKLKGYEEYHIDTPISSSLLFGNHLLVASEGTLHIIDIDERVLLKKIQLPCKSPTLQHPRDYLNKITLAEGKQLYLMNINTEKVLFTFQFPAKIVAVEQSPDIDIHAIALETGEIIIHDLRKNQKYVLCILCFINGLPSGDIFLVVGDISGVINVISIQSRVTIASLFHHTNNVHTLISFPNELHFYSVASDNSIKMFVIDPLSGTLVPALVRQRTGHPTKPHCVKFNGFRLVTASPEGSVRTSSIFNPMLNQELSQKVGKKAKNNGVYSQDLKLDKVRCIDTNLRYSLIRDSMVTTHHNTRFAVTWNFSNKVIGNFKMFPSVINKHSNENLSSAPDKEIRSDEIAYGTVCCFSHCGNFVFVGNTLGVIDKFNAQSGEHRQVYIGHKNEITGIGCDYNNKYLLTSSIDGRLLLWNFQNGTIITTLYESPNPITHFIFNKQNNLCCIIDAQNNLFVIDVNTRKIIRRLQLKFIPSCICFNNRGNYIFIAYKNAYFQVLDIISMKIIDFVQTKSAIISMDTSEDGQFLVTLTSKEDELQIYILRDYFSTVLLETPQQPYQLRYASNSILSADSFTHYSYDDSAISMEYEHKEIREQFELLEKTEYPTTKWINLPDLDRLRREMKLESSKKMEIDIPFFIPMQKGLNAVFKPLKVDSKLVNDQPKFLQSSLVSYLDQDDDAILNYLMTLSSSHIDLEIRNLNSDSFAHLNKFLSFIDRQLRSMRNYDFIITICQVTLRTHIHELLQNPTHANELKTLKTTIEEVWNPVDTLFNTDFSLLSFLSGITF